MTSVEEALGLAARGFHVFPIDHPNLSKCVGIRTSTHDPDTCTERGKHPYVPFTKQAGTDPKTIAMWFSGHVRNIGIFCGASDLLVVDEDKLGAFTEYAAGIGETIPETLVIGTGRGQHYYFRPPAGVKLGNAEGALKGRSINIRAGNAYVVGPSSKHANGTVYDISHDAPVAPCPGWLIDAITRARAVGEEFFSGSYIPALDRVPAVIKGPTPGAGGERHQVLVSYASSLRARNVPLGEAELLMRHVWSRCQQPPDCNTELSLDEALGKLRDCYERYDVADRYRTVTDDEVDTADGDEAAEAAPTTWEPFDLGPWLAGEQASPKPTVGISRSDGKKFLYPGKEHTVYGETEAGKSWLALECAAVEIRMGRDVVYIHYEEGDPGSTIERLRALAVPPAEIGKHLRFVAPNRPSRAGWLDALLDPPPVLVIHDGLNEAMSLHGDDIFGADGAATFRRNLIKPCLAVGAATLSCDHVTKSSEGRGRYAYGSGHKVNAVDGAAFMMENISPFGRGLRGASSVYVTKDRPGQLRALGKPTGLPGKTLIGVLTVDASPEAAEDFLTFWAPKDGDQEQGEVVDPRAELAAEVYDALLGMPGHIAQSGRKLYAAMRAAGISFTNTAARDALDDLVAEGKVVEVPGRNGAQGFKAVLSASETSAVVSASESASCGASPIGGEAPTQSTEQLLRDSRSSPKQSEAGDEAATQSTCCDYCNAPIAAHMRSQIARGYCNKPACIAEANGDKQ